MSSVAHIMGFSDSESEKSYGKQTAAPKSPVLTDSSAVVEAAPRTSSALDLLAMHADDSNSSHQSDADNEQDEPVTKRRRLNDNEQGDGEHASSVAHRQASPDTAPPTDVEQHDTHVSESTHSFVAPSGDASGTTTTTASAEPSVGATTAVTSSAANVVDLSDSTGVEALNALPLPLVSGDVDEQLRRRVEGFIAKTASGVRFNDSLHGLKEFHNPCTLDKLVKRFTIDEYASSVPPDKWSPSRWLESDLRTALKKQQEAAEKARSARQHGRSNISFASSTSTSASAATGSATSTAANAAAAAGAGTGGEATKKKKKKKAQLVKEAKIRAKKKALLGRK